MTVLCFLLLIASFANGQSDTKSSLTFVIDVTRSMESVRGQVEEHAHGIFDAVMRSNESDIENFVLVTFADPAALKTSVNNVTSTKDPDEFRDALSLTLVSGADCPEYSMSGIKTAIENSKSGSTIYVFTDASAKDYETYDHVKDMALKKEIRIIFILTGSCRNSSKKGYDVYTLLANDTSGQVFNLHKHSVFAILKWIKHSVVSRRILLKAKSFSPGDVLFLNYTTDLATRDTSISVSGCNKSLSVTGPDGKKLKLEDLVHLKNILVVKVNETKPGTHSVAFDCVTKTRLVVSAKSDIQFRHGFSGFVPTNLNDTTVKPSPEGKTYLSIKISGNFRPKTVNFVDADDNVIPGYSLPLKLHYETKELYTTGPFDTPFSMFRIIVTGLDLDHNATISRISYTFVEPQNPYLDKIINKKPAVVVERSPKILIEKGSFLQLKCTVNAFPKPKITWEKDGTILETNVYDYDLPYAYVSVHKIVNVNENSTFMCKANNSEGEDKQTLLVEVKSKPVFEVVEKPEDVTIKYNDLVHLKCKVDAYPHANVSWYKNGVSLSKENGITDDGSELMIQHMKLVNEGKYSCNVKNELQEIVVHFEIKISGVDTPKISDVTSDSLNFKEGTANTIACRIEKGTPEPTIHWYFDNGLGKYDEIVEAMDDEHLIMSNINRKQAGKYKCVAINELGIDMIETNVIVEYPPIIDNNTKLVTANAGDEVVLTCSGDGVPEPNITWTRDGKPLAGSKFTSSSDHRLIFEADMVDTAAYKCKASNKLGSSEKAVLVKVNKAPTSVILEGNSIEAEFDEPLTITCKILGFPKPDIIWVNKSGITEIKNYVIEEKSLYHFVSYLGIDRVTTNTTYQCKTNNTLGTDEAEITVITTKKPYFNILKNPEDKNHNVKYNDMATFFCKVDAYPPAEVNWYKNGRVLAKDDLYVSSNGSALTITHMDRVDQGMYKCEANNSITRFSFPFKLTVTGLEKPKINHAPTNINVNEKSNTSISCRIDAGIPKPSIQWFYKELSSEYVEIGDAKDLEYLPLTNIDRRDRGAYKCEANNSEGTDWMETNVIVEYMPTIDNDTEPIIAKAGDDVTLTCTADGVPKPIVQWTKDDMPLIGSKFTYGDHRLAFEVGWNDTGVYKCEASNPHGSKSKTINMEVYNAPIIRIKGKDKTNADIDEPLNVTCEVIGFPKPDITWINKTGNSELKYKIEEITPYHFVSRLNDIKVASKTTFQCKANNSLGASEDEIDIIVKPFFKDLQCPEDKTHDIDFNKTAVFVCGADAYPPAQVFWYKNGKVFPKKDLFLSSDGLTLTIKHMQPVDQGKYKCEVKNSITSSECPFDIRMSGVVKPKIFASVKTMNVVENSSVTIQCRIEKGTPKPTIKWYHKDIEIVAAIDREDLSYTNIKRGEQGKYKCIATNFAGNDTMETEITVEYSPNMTEDDNQTLSFLFDSRVILKCLSDGVPKPTITWSKDDSPLDSLKFVTNSDNSLEFDLGLDDSGTYKCMAANYLGTAIKSVNLAVDIPPTVVIEGDSKQMVAYDGFLQLKCYVHAHPAPDIRWTDTTSLRALFAPTFAIKPPYGYVSILNITRAEKNNTYQCGAENIHGDHKSSVVVVVGTKTYFNVIDEPRDIIIPYRTQGHLHCNIDAYPPAKITWYKDLKEIKSKNGLIVRDGILTLKNIESFQMGRYTCEAKNSEITKTFVAKVVVSGLESPKISRTSSEKIIREVLVRDVNINLSCKIEKGIPKPSIKWMYKNNHTSKYVEIKDASDLETYCVTVSGDTLQYACELSNLLGFDSLKMNLKLPVNQVIKGKGNKRRTLITGTPNALKLECRVKKTKNLPRPKIKWIYLGTEDNPKYELLISEDRDKSNDHWTTFKSYNVTYDQRGRYTCIATNNFGIQSSDTFTVDVNSPPIILNRVKVIRAVVHDTALSIHCIATGHPKPKFRWTHEGNTEEGGETLTLYNITTRHSDFNNRTASFNCEAYNSVGTDTATFKVIIDDYPSLDNPNSTLKLELGKDVPLVCPIPHGDNDFLRWYKNNKKLTDRELKIVNAKMSDAGLYTCRVSGTSDSRSANVDLKVGRMLVFTNTDVRTKIYLGVGEVVALDCSAMGIPNPRISWFHNGKAISSTDLYYRIKMNNAKCGIYKCEATNDFDTISRTFNVVLNECLLKIDPNDKRQPLILTQRFTSPTYKYEDGYLYMPQNQSVILTCGTNGTFNYFAYDYMNAFCNSAAKLEIEGDYDFSDLKCNKEVTPYVKWTGKACQGEDSEMVEIGYEIRTKTLTVYESCMDIVNDVPFYTKQTVSLPIAEVIPKLTWFEDRLKNNFEAMYDVDEQIERTSSTLGFWFHKVDRCVFTQRQLVDPQGVFPGVPQGATFTHLNVVPQWSSCSTKNWDDVESRMRNLLKSTDELTVWTGTAEKLSLKDSYLDDQKIYLSESKSRASPSPVSTYLWKVVQSRAKNASLAIIQINVPDLKPSDVYSYIKCRDVCSRTNWMNSPEWSKTDRGYVFCCSLDTFEYMFEYRGIFGRGMDNPLLHV